jgi:hypothetical protein
MTSFTCIIRGLLKKSIACSEAFPVSCLESVFHAESEKLGLKSSKSKAEKLHLFSPIASIFRFLTPSEHSDDNSAKERFEEKRK